MCSSCGICKIISKNRGSTMSAIDIITIVLSLVALAITIIGFFASLKFYRDGSQMQSQAHDALSKIEEKTSTIQSQVGGMFDKTLNAALGITNQFEIKQQQSSLQEPTGASLGVTSSTSLSGAVALAKGIEKEEEHASSVLRYFTFKLMRITDVNEANARALFNLGGGQGFNLFDGTSGIIFFGYFPNLDPVDIVARVRTLFTNIELSYKRVKENPDNQLAEAAIRLLDLISIELLIPENISAERLRNKIDEYQPTIRKITITLYSAGELEAKVAEEYEKMKI